MSRILVVDDKELMRDSVGTMLTRAGWTVVTAGSGTSALKTIAQRRPDVVLTDLAMPGMDGLALLKAIRQVDEQLPVVLMTAYATVQTAVQAMKQGAFDYLTKPFDGDQLTVSIRRAMDHARLVKENAVLKAQARGGRTTSGRSSEAVLIGQSRAMQLVREQISRIAPSHGTVLITGESGAGKEVVAASIHAASPRANAPLLALNCAALSTSLLESELFGHERGAFTGAEKLRKGRFELADGGTLLLDEISEIAPQIQAKLLRVLQEHTFERVGSSITRKTDVRVIATTNRDLTQSVRNGAFRQDLYYRLNVLPLEVPPLRHHLDDVAILCAHFLDQVARREGKPAKRLEPAAIDALRRYPWPGNIRELSNICERASIFCTQDVIPVEMIQPWLSCPIQKGSAAGSETRRADSDDVAPRHAAEVGVVVVGGGGPHPSNGGASSCASEGWMQQPAAASPVPIGAANTVSGDDSPLPAIATDPLSAAGWSPPPGPATGSALLGDGLTIETRGRSLEEIERDVIVATLRRNGGHRKRTACELQIAIRTLGLKLRKWKELELVDSDL